MGTVMRTRMEQTVMKTVSLALLLIISACGAGKIDDVPHPAEHLFPYKDNTVQEIIIEPNLTEVDDVSAATIKDFIHSEMFESIFHTQLIDSQVVIPADLKFGKFRSIDLNRLIFLDVLQNTLFEYNINEQQLHTLATEGRGPGELLFAKDLLYSDSYLYVTLGDSRVGKFDCNQQPCQFVEEQPVREVNPVSVVLNNNRLTVMGTQSKFTNPNEFTDNPTIRSLFTMTEDGNIDTGFGQYYDVLGQWMLMQPFIPGRIRGIQDYPDLMIQSFDLIPELYVFNKGVLEKKLIFTGFNLAKYKYDLNTSELHVPTEDWSSIEQLIPLKDGTLLAAVHHYDNYTVKERRANWDESMDYYIVNILDGTSRFVGRTTYDGEHHLTLTDKHLILATEESFNVFSLQPL